MAAVAAPDASPKSGDNGKAVIPANPFTKASRRKAETFLDTVVPLTASTTPLRQVEIPANGYMRHLVLDVEVTGVTAAAYKADAPWNIIDTVTLTDVGGSNAIVLLTGFDLFVANLYGAYNQNADPRKLATFNTTATGFRFQLRVPVEVIMRNAFGALPNLNAAMTYKLRVVLAPQSEVFSAVTGTPSVRVRGLVESWSNPPAADLRGTPNMTTPPALGTTQNWSTQALPIVLGRNTHRLSRVGNTIRNIVFVARDATGVRSEAVLPDDISLLFDGNQIFNVPLSYLRQRTQELYGQAGSELLAGVVVLSMCDDFDGTPGEETGDFYLTTTGGTRLELQGQWKAAGNLIITTNDILASAATGGAGATLGTQG